MNKLSYAAKARLTSLTVMLLIVGGFAVLGFHYIQTMFALTPAPEGITVFTEKTAYRIGETVTVTVANATKSDVYVANNCPNAPLTVYRQNGPDWQKLDIAADKSKCIGEPQAYVIPAEHSVKVGYKYWPGLFAQPGTYRIAAIIGGYSTGPTATFTVSR